MNDTLTTEQIEASHIIDDLATEKATLRRAARQSMDLLTDALHAHDNGSAEVVNEYLERSIEMLYQALDKTRA